MIPMNPNKIITPIPPMIPPISEEKTSDGAVGSSLESSAETE